jgi:L-amino acid N-acyltransferase
MVRDAHTGDVPAILAIHNDIVATSDAIFSEILDTLDGRREWLEARQTQGYPVLVAEVSGEVAGFASYGPFRTWPGYRDTVEHSVHVSAERRGAGVGRALLIELIDRARSGGIHVMIAGIDAANEISIALHSSLGFTTGGRLSEVGVKHGRRLDLVFMQLTFPE